MSAQEIDEQIRRETVSQCYTSFTRQGGNVYPESETEQALRAETAALKAQVEMMREKANCGHPMAFQIRTQVGFEETHCIECERDTLREALLDWRHRHDDEHEIICFSRVLTSGRCNCFKRVCDAALAAVQSEGGSDESISYQPND